MKEYIFILGMKDSEKSIIFKLLRKFGEKEIYWKEEGSSALIVSNNYGTRAFANEIADAESKGKTIVLVGVKINSKIPQNTVVLKEEFPSMEPLILQVVDFLFESKKIHL